MENKTKTGAEEKKKENCFGWLLMGEFAGNEVKKTRPKPKQIGTKRNNFGYGLQSEYISY